MSSVAASRRASASWTARRVSREAAMDAVTHPFALTPEPAWGSAAPVLDALLSIGDANDESAHGAQQLTKQYAAMNATRLWELIQRTVAKFHEPVRLVNVSGPRGRWGWPADGIGVQMPTQIQIEIRSDHALFAVTLQ